MLSHQKDFHKKSQANDDEKFLMMPSILLTKDFSPKMMNHKMVFKWRYTKYFWKKNKASVVLILMFLPYLDIWTTVFSFLEIWPLIFQSFF